ncbi:uncharacterized protein LOC118791462 [Megalops cyprinoides]|uniref:uncharacterized protein LOC118791462 n=1 Tax=Megalops cyprinoides TaxID=118141 RepID=UPI0018644D9F|nr:uncharacterized protein LOC118791462 [Megalops cyprinoides]
MFRSLECESPEPCEIDENKEGSIPSQPDSDSIGSDLERFTRVQEDMIEFKLSYEMWRVSTWAVSVTQVQEESEELCFTIHLEEKNNPEKLHWDMRKTQTEIRNFVRGLQDPANLPSISELVESTERTMNDEFKEEAKTTLKNFLEVLVSDSQLGQSLAVFQFLCPLERLLNEEEPGAGVWGLLSSLAYFLTPVQEEEEDISPQSSDKQDDSNSEGLIPGSGQPGPEGCYDASGQGSTNPSKELPAEPCKDGKNLEAVSDVPSENVPVAEDSAAVREPDHSGVEFRTLRELSSSACSLDEAGDPGKAGVSTSLHNSVCKPQSSQEGDLQCDATDGPCFPFSVKSNKKEKLLKSKMPIGIHNKKGKDHGCMGRAEGQREQEPHRKEVIQSSKEQQEAIKAIFDLVKEISGYSILVNIFDAILKPFMPLLKRKVNSFLIKLSPTEAQMASYIDRLREKQWPEGETAASGPCRTKEQKNETKERAHRLINTRCSNAFILKKNDVEAVFKLFQDTEENKKLVYMLLSFLLREIMPGESALNVKAIALLNSPI